MSDLEKCAECGFELPSDANSFSVDSDGLIQKVKVWPFCGSAVRLTKENILRDADVKRIIVRNSEGETLLTMPVTWGAAGALATVALAPWLAALGVVAALATRVTIEVQRAL